jgi:hypothetical protein
VKEIWDLATSPGVVWLTLLLGPMALFWIACFIGTLDFDFIGVDFGEGGVDSGDGITLFGGTVRWLFRFVHGDDVPIMALLSFLLVFEWGCVMLGNLFWNPTEDLGQAGKIAALSLVPALFLTKFTGLLLSPMFRILKGTEGEAKPVIGRRGQVRSRVLDDRSGQVEVEDPEVPLLINARLASGADALVRGDSVVVESHDADRDVYLVSLLTDSNQ